MTTSQRDERLFGAGPKNILCLDGGGIRGIVTVGMLETVEAHLRARQPADKQANFRLSDHYNLIVGTSTGSIIATLLAMGKSVAEVRDYYMRLGPTVFARPRLLGQLIWSKFDHVAFERLLEETLSDRTLNSGDLKTGLLITCKRVDTGSAWIQGNNTRAKFWEYDRDRRLRDLVRASTAAPSYFQPILIHVGAGEEGLFLDGAMGGLNNPSVAAFLYGTADEYGLKWPTGEAELSMLSLGTGFIKPTTDAKRFDKRLAADKALITLKGLIYETQTSAVSIMQAFSNPPKPFEVNSEIKGFENTLIGGRALLRYQRYDPPLARDKLETELGLRLSAKHAIEIQSMDNGRPKNIERLLSVGRAMGERIAAATVF